MQHADYPRKCLRFGVFEADPRIGELTKHGKRLPLQEQPFQLLAMLLERPGELVSREELRAKIWPETIVDFDQGLNKAISKIREALGDAAENPRFIETVRSEEHTSELQSHSDLVCRLLLEKKKKKKNNDTNVAS